MISCVFDAGERVALETGLFDDGLPVFVFAKVIGTNPEDGQNSWILEREDDGTRVLVYRWDDGTYRAVIRDHIAWITFHLDNPRVRRVLARGLSADVVAQAEAILAAAPSEQAEVLAAKVRQLQEMVDAL